MPLDGRRPPAAGWRRAALGWRGAAALIAIAGAAVVVLSSGPVGSASIVGGPVPAAAVTVSAAGLAVGVARRGRRWWTTWAPGIAAAGGVVVVAAAWWLRHTGIVTDHYPPTFLLWTWLALTATGVALTGWWDGGAAVRVVRVLTAPVVVLSAFFLINAHYGYWPTMDALLGRPVVGQVAGSQLHAELARRGDTAPLPSELGRGSATGVGQYGPVAIPGRAVGFDASTAYVWLPPDYFEVQHADLPVLLMLPGWPGSVADWQQAGEVVTVADRWAAAHDGVAPVMIFVDENGASRDTECVNGRQGNAESYLTRIIPRYARTALGIRAAPQRWAVVGFSEGGTCAAGLAMEDPGLWGRFVDLSGDLAPDFGTSARQTLWGLYGGDTATERAHEPLVLLASHRYDHTIGWFGAGLSDTRHTQIAKVLARASRRAGMVVHLVDGPGGHSWTFVRTMFPRLFPQLVRALGEPTHTHSAARLLGAP